MDLDGDVNFPMPAGDRRGFARSDPYGFQFSRPVRPPNFTAPRLCSIATATTATSPVGVQESGDQAEGAAAAEPTSEALRQPVVVVHALGELLQLGMLAHRISDMTLATGAARNRSDDHGTPKAASYTPEHSLCPPRRDGSSLRLPRSGTDR